MASRGKRRGTKKQGTKKKRTAGTRRRGAVASTRSPITLAKGPSKAVPEGLPAPRLSTHKTRARWFAARTAWPYRDAAVSHLARQRDVVRRALPDASLAARWELVGPTNIGGRATAVVCDPSRPERIWIGAAGGGVWFSRDAGGTWTPQWHSEDVLNVGALAIDPKNPLLLYCGTGEANLSSDSYPGVGIYRTLDGGTHWTLFAAVERTGLPRRIGEIAIDPFDSAHLIVGGVGLHEVAADDDWGGLYRSTDAGVTWARETAIAADNYWCHSVVFDPSTRGRVYATVTVRGTASGVYRSVDGAKTWTQLTKGLGATERIGRSTIAASPSDPQVLYLIAQDSHSGNADRALGVFRSTNGGDAWKNVAGSHFAGEGQMSYGNTIVVHPNDPDHVLCGGVDLHLTTNGGKTWAKVTRWNADRGAADYAHADHHALLMPAASPGRVYDANDGGLDSSEDGGRTWANRSNGLATTMFYDFDVCQADARAFGGGAQDNGTLVTTTGRPDDHFELLGGDGGWIVFDPKDASHVFASYYNFHIYRFRGQASKEVSPPAGAAEQGAVWMCYIAMDAADPRRLFTASSRVWRTLDDAASWKAVSPVLDDSPVTAIEIAPADRTKIYVGTENGGIFRSTDGGDTWSANLASALLPGHTITRLTTDPARADTVYASVANQGHSHVFRSSDGARTWEDVDNGRLPDVAHHAVLVPRANTLFVANDVGVFGSDDGGATWRNFSLNLPHAMVVDLVYHRKSRALYAATYGRSTWRLTLDQT